MIENSRMTLSSRRGKTRFLLVANECINAPKGEARF